MCFNNHKITYLCGEECYVLFSGKLGFGSRIVGTIPRNSALAYHLWIKSVSNN